MKLPRNVEYTVKINNCIDELLMQDMTFNQQSKKVPQLLEQTNEKNQRNYFNKSKGLSVVGNQRQSKFTNQSQQLIVSNNKISPYHKSNINQRRKRVQNQVNRNNKQLTEQINIKKRLNITLSSQQHKNLSSQQHKNNNNNKQREQIFQNTQYHRTINLNKQTANELKLKKTYSFEVKDDNQLFDHVIESNNDDSHSPKYLLTTNNKDQYFNKQGNSLLTSISKKTRSDKATSIRDNIIGREQSRGSKKRARFIKQQKQTIKQLSQNQYFRTSGQFNLSHQQLQFLSLLYPNESPQQLMLKLLSYYQQQQQYNNSFQQLFQTNEEEKKNQFFRTRHQINLHIPDSIIQLQTSRKQSNNNDDDFIKYKTISQQKNNKSSIQNNYSRLKQQCLAALGQQMVQTQIKSQLAQTANVNYYTRQYAMPIIIQTIAEKNQQSQYKLQKLQQSIKTNQQLRAQKIQQITMTINQQKIAAVLAQNYQSINSQLTSIPSQFIHKVYIPANSRGQSFDIDYKPQPKLFQYITQNQYRRILRDINHLIQKVLSYHRHSSFLKRKNNSLLKGWNLALLIFLFIIIAMLYVKSFFIIESNYLQIIVFFCLSFIVILILGNSFNNYKRNVKRSSVIKDICQQITNYLDFINSSNKNIKWVLGKDFFWLQIWIDVIKNNHIKK